MPDIRPPQAHRVALAQYAWTHNDLALCAATIERMTHQELQDWLAIAHAALPFVTTSD